MSEATSPARSSGSATLQDVAREAGVSLATASRALNGSSRRVADAYRERVEAAAARLGYAANLSAQATARGTAPIVALLVADLADPYFGGLASGVAQAAEAAGLVVTISVIGHDPQREARLVRALRGQRPRGLILAASRTSDAPHPELAEELAQLEAGGCRVVALGTAADGARTIPIDHRGGAAALGAALAARGYRRAIVLAAKAGVATGEQRLEGFAAGFASGGGRPPRVLRGDFSRESGRAMMQQALADGVEPGTLVFGISDVVAIGAMGAVRAAGRALGGDIAVAGFDDIPTSSDVVPALTTVRVPLKEVGRQAFAAAIDEAWCTAPQPMPVAVVLRDSTPELP